MLEEVSQLGHSHFIANPLDIIFCKHFHSSLENRSKKLD